MSGLPVISVSKLHISFPGSPAAPVVDDLSFSLDRGNTLAIVGETGAGKSLTALALMGLLPPGASWSGMIDLKGGDARHIIKPGMPGSDWGAIRGRAVSILFQEPERTLNPVMKLGHQLAEALSVTAVYEKKQLQELSLEWLARVHLPDPKSLYHRYPHQITPSQRQRLLIAIAMAGRPDLLIADEPSVGFDAIEQREILLLLRNLQLEFGTAMIFITRDISLASELADELLVLRDGQVVDYGPADDLLSDLAHPYTRALLACRPGPATIGKKLPVESDFGPEGTEPELQPLPPLRQSGRVLLKVRHLRVWFPTETNLLGTPTRFLRAVEDVSFDLNQGEALGLVGESGCGKSTISRALIGLESIESGTILFEERDLARMGQAAWRRMRRQIQMIFPDGGASLNPRLTIGEAIREPLVAHRIVARKELDNEVKRLREVVGLPAETLSLHPDALSSGQLQRVAIARALALRPELIICDEILSGLDVCTQAEILNLLKSIQAEYRLSYLFISHDLNAVRYLADKVVVMQAGSIVERGTTETVLQHPKHEYTQRLVGAE